MAHNELSYMVFPRWQEHSLFFTNMIEWERILIQYGVYPIGMLSKQVLVHRCGKSISLSIFIYGTNKRVKIVDIVSFFPSFVNHEQNLDLVIEIHFVELDKVIDLFKEYKNLGLDGWPIKLCVWFFELLGNDMLLEVEKI